MLTKEAQEIRNLMARRDRELDAGIRERVLSNPPSAKYRVKNIYADPDEGEIVIEYEDTPA